MKFFFITILILPLFSPLAATNSDSHKPTATTDSVKSPPSPQTTPPPTTEPNLHTTPESSSTHIDTMENYENSFLKMFITLIGLIAAIFLTIWALRRLASGRLPSLKNSHLIKVVERKPLSQKTILYLLEVAGKQIIIAESQLEIKKIALWDDNIVETD